MPMKAMEILQQYWEQIKRLLIYAQYCADNDIRTLVCHDFWMWTIYASLGFALLIAIVLGKKIFKVQSELYRNKKRLEARKIVADSETIEQAKWKGEDNLEVELSQEELAARMREALKVRAELEARAGLAAANSKTES